MSLLKTYTKQEKAALKKHGLTNDQHSQLSDAFVLGVREVTARVNRIERLADNLLMRCLDGYDVSESDEWCELEKALKFEK